MHAKYGYDGFGRRLWKLVKEGNAKPKLTVFSWDANLLTSEEVFEGEFHFWDTSAYPKEPELEPEDPSKKFSLPIAQRVHTLTARALKRTHWLYEPERFIPAAQLVDTYDQHAQRMTGTGSVAYSSTVSAVAATAEPQLYYIHTDHLGTPQELTDRDGNLQWVGHYRAWGELAKANDSVGNAASVEMPLRFQGQYCDAETGLHYNRFRYYDPQVGRFTTQDPISLAGGVNLYQYAPNPINWADPLGLTPCQSRADRQARINELAEANAHRRLQEMENTNPRSHFLERHGAQTSLDAQYERAAHGTNPTTGAAERKPSAATRFTSHRDQLNVIQKAQTIRQRTGEDVISIPHSGQVIGEGYSKMGPTYGTSHTAQVVFGQNGQVVTAYPIWGK